MALYNKDKTNDIVNYSPPWLQTAYQEALKFSGRNPADDPILKNIVSYYYHGFGAGYVQYANWCAAFVSFCLKKGGLDLGEFKGTACSQDFLNNPYFLNVSYPIYGCIAVWTNRDETRFGHVAFAIGKGKSKKDNSFNKSIIALGGNQSNTIKFSAFPGPESDNSKDVLHFSGFLIPRDHYSKNDITIPLKKMVWSDFINLNHEISPSLHSHIYDTTT